MRVWSNRCRPHTHILEMPQRIKVLENSARNYTKDQFLIKLLLLANNKAITRKKGKVEPPCEEQRIETVEEIHTAGKLTFPETTRTKAGRKTGEIDIIQNPKQRRRLWTGRGGVCFSVACLCFIC